EHLLSDGRQSAGGERWCAVREIDSHEDVLETGHEQTPLVSPRQVRLSSERRKQPASYPHHENNAGQDQRGDEKHRINRREHQVVSLIVDAAIKKHLG